MNGVDVSLNNSVIPISRRQNSAEMLDLLRAMSASHVRVRRLHAVRVAISLLVAGLSLVAAFVNEAAAAISVAGGVWALTQSLGLGSLAGGEVRRAAVIQEMFDARLYGLPWNQVAAGDQVAAQEVSYLAKRYRGPDDELIDYYEIPDVPPPFDVVACQVQNLGWGARIRRRYASVVLATLITWSCAGLVVGVLAELTVAELVMRWYVPSLGALLLGADIYRSQREVAGERERVFAILLGRVTGGPDNAADVATLTRQVQDAIFLTRRDNVRVPDWFFRRFRPADRTDFQAAMAHLEATLRRGAAPRTPHPDAGTR